MPKRMPVPIVPRLAATLAKKRPKLGYFAAQTLRHFEVEMRRQRGVVERGEAMQERLYPAFRALRRLLEDPNFVNLLRAEDIGLIPARIGERTTDSSPSK